MNKLVNNHVEGPVLDGSLTFKVESSEIDLYKVIFTFAAEVVAGSAAWLGRGLSCVCAQRRESDPRPSFDLTPAQVIYIFLPFSFSLGNSLAWGSYLYT